MPQSWISSFQNSEKIYFGCLSHPLCAIVLWQPVLRCYHGSLTKGRGDLVWKALRELRGHTLLLTFWLTHIHPCPSFSLSFLFCRLRTLFSCSILQWFRILWFRCRWYRNIQFWFRNGIVRKDVSLYSCGFLKYLKFLFIEVQLMHNIMLVSGVQDCDSTMMDIMKWSPQ